MTLSHWFSYDIQIIERERDTQYAQYVDKPLISKNQVSILVLWSCILPYMEEHLLMTVASCMSGSRELTDAFQEPSLEVKRSASAYRTPKVKKRIAQAEIPSTSHGPTT